MIDRHIRKYKLNNTAVWSGALFKKDGQVLAKPETFVLRPLTRSDARQMADLSDVVYDGLPPEHKCFIHKRQRSYYFHVFEQKDVQYIGVFSHGKLIGMSYMHVCKDRDNFLREIPDMPEKMVSASDIHPVAAFGSDSVLKAYRGNQLNKIMIMYRQDLARAHHCRYVTSIIDRQNHWNMSPYFDNGFRMCHTAVDPSDNGAIALMVRDLSEPKLSGSCVETTICLPYNRPKLIDYLLQQGFSGVRYHPDTAEIEFRNKLINIRSSFQNSLAFRLMYRHARQRQYG